jgi:hypothetical protein
MKEQSESREELGAKSWRMSKKIELELVWRRGDAAVLASYSYQILVVERVLWNRWIIFQLCSGPAADRA